MREKIVRVRGEYLDIPVVLIGNPGATQARAFLTGLQGWCCLFVFTNPS